jgi:hypothetical protein
MSIENIDNEFIVKHELLHMGRTETAENAAKGSPQYLRIMEENTEQHGPTF